MKKYICLTLLLMFCALTAHASVITVDNFLSPDDVTISHLELFRSATVNAINNADGGLLQARTITPEKLTKNADVTIFRDEAFNDWIYTGLLPPTSVSLTSITTLGTAYVGGQRIEKDATSHTYTASKWTFADLKNDGTYIYTELNIGDADPAISNNTVRLARVSSDGTTINAVRDDRRLALTIDNTQEDYYRKGLVMRGSNTTTDAVQITPGVCYWGTVRTKKTTLTTLGLGTAGDWVSGGGSQANATMGFVVMNNAGAIKLTTTAPGYADTAGNTLGPKMYSKIGTTYYRCLAWFYMNGNAAAPGTAGDDISPWEWGNFQWDVPSLSSRRVSPDVTTTSGAFVDVADTSVTFYCPSGRPVNVTGIMSGYSSQQYYAFNGAIKLDNALVQDTEVATSSTTTTDPNTGGGSLVTIFATPELEAGTHTVKLMFRGSYTQHLSWANVYVEVK